MAVKKKSERPKPKGATKVYDDAYIERIAKDLDKWAEKSDSLFLDQFIGNHPEFFTLQRLSEWADLNKVFGETFSKVKKKLCGRIKAGSMHKSYDGNFAAKILPLVDMEYRQWRREELKLEAEAKQAFIVQPLEYTKKPEK